MTTFLTPTDALTRRYDSVGRDSHSLLDQFWDAVVIPTSEPVNIRDSFCSIEETVYERAVFQSPEIFSKTGSNPVINVKSMRSPNLNDLDADRASDPGWPTVPPNAQFGPCHSSRHIQVEHVGSLHPPQITLQPATPLTSAHPSKKSRRRPKLAIPNHVHRQGNGISSPGSALLALASNFLGIIVKLGRSQPSTPVAKSEENGIQIVDSTVFISVVDDVVRSRQDAALMNHNRDGMEWLDSAAFSSTHSPFSSHRQASSAEEMDTLAKISWERQLMNVQGTLWH